MNHNLRQIILLFFIFIPPLLLGAQPLKLNTMALPSRISPGEWTRVQIQTTDEDGEPLSDVIVTLRAAGGLFAVNRKTVVEDETDSNGLLIAEWTCESCVALYSIEVTAQKNRLGKVTQILSIDVDLPPRQQPPAFQLSTTPRIAAPGESVTLRVTASRDTLPVPGAKVELSASGGLFISPDPSGGLPNYVTGFTDSLGIFLAVWRCEDCATKYDFNMRLTARESPSLRGETAVTIDPTRRVTSDAKSGAIRGKVTGCEDCGFVQIRAVPGKLPGKDFSVQVSSGCNYHFSLSPGLYYLEPVWTKKEMLGKKKLEPQKLKVNVVGGRETVVDFKCGG